MFLLHTMRAAFFLATGLALLSTLPVRAGTIEGRVQAPSSAGAGPFVLWVDDIEGRFTPPSQAAVLDQKNLEFVPHVLAVLAGTTVRFPNSDPLLHNVFSISPGKRFNLGLYGQGVERQVTFDVPGVVEVLCNVHLEMSAYIVVLKNPYFARTQPDGSFRIADVPAGRHRLRLWLERAGEQEHWVEVPESGAVAVEFGPPQAGRHGREQGN